MQCKNKHCGKKQNNHTKGWFNTLPEPMKFLLVPFIPCRVAGYCSDKCWKGNFDNNTSMQRRGY